MAGHDPLDSTCADRPNDVTRGLHDGVDKMRLGVPREYFEVEGMEPGVRLAIQKALKTLEAAGAELVDVSLPHTDYGLAAYYIIAPAECSSNLARFDGVRYGMSEQDAQNITEAYTKTRRKGFGAEVRRRVMLGTYALSTGYYDAYYLKAQKVRTLIKQDFDDAFANCDAIVSGTSPAVAPLNAPPNSHTCPVCLGLPGVLPVINRAAVEACLKTAVALNCEIPRHTKFDRKNYMYPDLPKGYQISQYDLPMSHDGHLEVGERRVRIRRVHLEEDTGKLVHAGDRLHKAWESFVDLNRAGVPLMEIVSEPDIRSAEEARDYAMALRTLLRTVGASEADMEKGQLRAEPNISVRRTGTTELGVKTELKNINSFRNLYRAIDFEVKRQIEALESGQGVVQETRGWSDAEQRTFSQRTKEFAQDYRYFPEPDLPPLEVERKWIDELRRNLPELPSVRRARLLEHLPAAQVAVIGADRELADLYENAVAKGAPELPTANWIVNEVAPTGKLSPPENLAELMKLLHDGAITRDSEIGRASCRERV